MSRRRVTRFLLWGGLALFIVGTSACTVGCLGAASSAFSGNPEGESLATGGILSGFLMVTISLLMIAEQRFRRLKAPELIEDVYLGAQYADGIAIESTAEKVAA